MSSKLTRLLALVPLAALLSGCNLVLLNPAGDIAAQQRDLLVVSTGLMLIIVIPVIFLTLWFAWRYRQSNTEAKYDPEWHHSTRLEVVIWSAPLAIIIALGALTWVSTHLLDPYRPLSRIDESRPLAADHKPLEVEVIAMDWKWLFIYPEQGIATVNELAAPVDTPIRFKITSTSVMNALAIPALAGMIYAMPGMETKLHAVINQPGVYDGLSGNYSGAGFAGMRFKFHGLAQNDFDAWVAKVRANQTTLGRPEYLTLERPSEREPVRYFGTVDPELYHAILNMCVDKQKMCMDEMMHVDAKGGMGLAGTMNVARMDYDRRRRVSEPDAPGGMFVLASACTPTDPFGVIRTASADQVTDAN